METYDPSKKCPVCMILGSLLLESGFNHFRNRKFERWICSKNHQWREVINESHREYHQEIVEHKEILV